MSKQSDPYDNQAPQPWLEVDSFEELMNHENEIVQRINSFPNGAQLFLIHPFRLLADIGVALSERAEQEIRLFEPRITGLSDLPYNALKNNKAKQHVRFTLRGLFERRAGK
ncbi:MAG: hypothetical protein M3441_17775 [Chloroflexota bacterium]|nr:hypothetical protein [Chloroflexota bacterium]